MAEQLLAKVLEWSPEDVARERPVVQALAAYKYDEYQQFSAGSRFIESLALWLNQFQTSEERRTAYAFVKTRLIFCSSAELRHFVEMAYPDYIRPFLIGRSSANPTDRFRPRAVVSQNTFKVHQRQCLFLGLSDGARIDSFRRSNPALNHEQIWQTHELSEDRVGKLLDKLAEHLQQILGRVPIADERKFRTLVLMDDFSASGTSYYALPANAPTGGKIYNFFSTLCDETNPRSRLVNTSDLEVFILLYIATAQALEHMTKASEATWGAKGIRFTIKAVQQLGDEIKLRSGDGSAISGLIQEPRYYDHSIYDAHFQKGGTPDARFGYAGCGLPVVLHQNTPNNSIALLMSYEDKSFRGLFPRIQRHKEM